MEITTDNATSSKIEATKITSVEPVSDLNKYTVITITGMEPQFHRDAVKGNINDFEWKGEQIESILTPNKNTILHIHFTNCTNGVSKTFVKKVLDVCPALLLKTNVKGDTILHMAARYGHHKIVKNLIDYAKNPHIYEAGAEKRLIRAINDNNDTALHEAARYGHNKLVNVLLKEEPDHSYFGKNVDDETPLYIAVERQHWKVVDAILADSDSPQYNGPNGRTALHAAVIHGDEEYVQKLLEGDSSAAKQADDNGWVPLHLAALCAESDVVEELVSKDRSMAYMRDNEGRTALHFAALLKKADVMEKIIEYCPDCCELVDEKGSNALHYSVMLERHSVFGLEIQSVSGLEDTIENTPLRNLCNEKDDDGNTPLHLLARQASTENDHPLLKADLPNLDKLAFNKYGQTSFDVAFDVVPSDSALENKMLRELRASGARLGGRVLDRHLKKKKQEKRVVGGEKEKQYKTNGQDRLAGMATTLSVVATLIATVTFTAGFTLPGGLIQEGEHRGSPILKYNAAFMVFVLTDSLSFVLSISVVFFLFFSSALAKEKELSEALLDKCRYLTMGAMVFMIIAFGTGIYAVMGVSKGFGIITLFIVFSVVVIIVIVFRIAFRGLRERFMQCPHGVQLSCVRIETDVQLSQIL
ncbi:ankyrin repeat-containing protein At5g02620-like [Neltuma alba]|uniref:ankyrin repeat-containing protein At5g02620-like n=1 Tax=Neltuma alba TaxID=207710 RepID=UPI0010A3DCB2|nr:ankyrin repeat-containing protein At5g02620-like [Prosopis alba]